YLAEEVGGLGRARAVVAEDDDRGGGVDLVDAVAELVERDQGGARDPGDLPLLGVADVEEEDLLAGAAPAVQLLDGDVEAGLDLLGLGRDAAELLVVDELVLGGVLGADGAGGVLLELELAEAHLQSVEEQQAADERLADADDELDRLVRLESADDPRQHPEDPALGAGGDEAGRRRLGEEAAVAGTPGAPEDRHLALEAEDRPVDVGLARKDAGVVDEVAGGKVVGAVDDDVVGGEELHGVAGVQARVVRHQLDQRVDLVEAGERGVELRPADVRAAVEHLAMEIRLVDDVELDEPEGADPRRRQVETDRRAQAAAADHQHAGGLQPPLPLGAHLGHDEV